MRCLCGSSRRRAPLFETGRSHAFGQHADLTIVDRLGTWMSRRRIRGTVGSFQGLRVGDLGAGFDALFVRSILDDVESALVVDVSLSPDLHAHSKVTAMEGGLPGILGGVPSESLDLVVCTSVIEHLWDPLDTLRAIRRLLAPGGMSVLSVPSWRGRRYLEFSAFTLGLSPLAEIDDHKTYYNPADLWPLLVRAGFRPRDIKCARYKFGLNTYAVCRTSSPPPTSPRS